MSAVANVQKDFLDVTTSYFTCAKPREFFKTIHQLFFWNKYLTGKETSAVSLALSSFCKVFDAFNILDLMDNLNNLRNHLSGKDVKDVSLLMSDTVNSACETTTWLSATTGIISLSATALRWTKVGSGATLMYSFAKNSISEIKDFINKPLSNDEKNIKLFSIAKNVSLFAIGVLLVISGLLLAPLKISLLTVFGGVTIICDFAKYIFENNQDIKLSS